MNAWQTNCSEDMVILTTTTSHVVHHCCLGKEKGVALSGVISTYAALPTEDDHYVDRIHWVME